MDSVIIRERAIDSLLSHALRSAKADGNEVIGWLLGFFREEGVCVSESVPCTRYLKQSRFGAEADPAQEAEVASSYPRNVGIVGLYHSHPFALRFDGGHFRRISSLDDIFHSMIDDSMLKSRSSRRKNYLSIVTNGIDFSCFVMDRRSRKIEPTLVPEIPYKDSLRSYECVFKVDLSTRIQDADSNDMIAEASNVLIRHVRERLKEHGPSLENGGIHRRYRKSRRRISNILRIEKEEGALRMNAHLTLLNAVYTAKKDEREIERAMRDEILDNTAFLLWKLSSSNLLNMNTSWKTVEIHLGHIDIDESGPLPRKEFQIPERGMTIKRS